MAILKRALIVLGIILLIPVLVLGAAFFYLTTAQGLSTIASLVSTYASSDDTKINVGGIDGSFPTDLTLKDVVLSDRKGEWLKLDRARVVWSPLQLYSRKLVIDAVDLGRVEVLRQPDYPEADDNAPPPDPNAPLFPELPIEIHLEKFLLSDLDLAAPVIGTPARLTANASATVRQPKQGVFAQFDVQRTDGTMGRFGGKARFVPANEGVEISLRGSEPAGGLVARMADIPGLPPIDLGIEGSGTLDALRTQMVFTAGTQGRIDGVADVKREGKARRVTLNLTGDVAGIAQPAFSRLVEGQTKISVDGLVPDEGPIEIRDALVEAAAARLGARGLVDTDKQTLDVAYDLKAGDAARFSSLLPGVGWRSLSVLGSAKGPIDHPTVNATIDGGALSAPQGSAETARVTLSATPDGPLATETTKIAATVKADVQGVKFAGDRLFASGRPLTLDAAAVTDLNGFATIERADLKLDDARVSYVGMASPEAAKGRATVNAPNLATLAPLAGLPLAGTLEAASDIDVVFDMSRLNVSADVTGTSLVTGVEQLDRVTGGSLKVKGGITRAEDGSFAFRGFDARGDHIVVTADGSATQERADAKIRAEIDDLALVEPRTAGAATMTADLSGKLDELGLKARIDIPDGKAMDRALTGFQLDIDAADITGEVGGTLAMSGSLDGRTVKGAGALESEPNGLRRIRGLDLTIAGSSIKGDLAVAPGKVVDGKLTIASPDLSEVGALALMELAGSLDGEVLLYAENNVQRVKVDLDGADIVYPGVKVGALDVAATVIDPAGNLTVDGTAKGSAIAAGGQVVDTLSLVSRGAPNGMDVALDMGARGSSLVSKARVAYAPRETRIDLSQLDLKGGGQTASLNAPAVVRLVGPDVAIDSFSLKAGSGGVVDVAGRAGQQLDLTVAFRELPLALGNAFSPGLDLSGMAAADAKITGAANAPNADYDIRISGLSIAQLRNARVPALSIASKGRLEGERVTTDTAITGAGGLNVTAQGSGPLGAGDLDMNVVVRSLPLSLANAFQPELGFGGRLEADARITGPVSAPNGTYRAKVVDFTSTRARGVAPVSVDATGELLGERVTTNLNLTGGGGIRASVKGFAPLGRGDVDMDVAIAELPLAIANAFAPELGLGGELRATARVTGPLEAPRGIYDINVVNLKTLLARDVPALTIASKGNLEGKTVTTDTAISGGGGLQVTARGSAPLGEGDIDLGVAIRELPLSIANAVRPDLGLGGTARGDIRLSGPVTAPRGNYNLRVTELVTALARGVPAIEINTRGALEGQRVTTQTTITGGGIDMAATGAAPIGEGDLDMTVTVRELPLSIANAFKPELGLGGALRGSAKFTGPVKAPSGTYDVTVADITAAPARGVPALLLIARGALAADKVTTDALLSGGGGIQATAKGAVPLGEGNLDLDVGLKAFPLALANAFRPDLGLGGEAQGTARLTGPISAPIGTYDLAVSNLTTAQARAVPPLAIVAKGDLQGDRVSTDTTVTGGGGVSLTAKGTAPLGQGDLNMAIAIRELPLALANAVKPDLGLTGVLRGDARVTGPVTAPQGTYDLTIADLLSTAAKGVPALQVATKGALEGNRVTTDTSVTGGGGIQITAKGSAPIGEGDLDMGVTIREVPLALANAFKPELGLAGVLKGDALVQGPISAPRGNYNLAVSGLTSVQAKGVPAVEIATKGLLEGNRVTTDTVVSGGGGIGMTARGSAPLGMGDVDMTVQIAQIPLALANAVMPSLGLGGVLKGDARVAGTVTAPQGTYDLRIENLTSAQGKGVPALLVATKGTLEGKRVTTDTAVTGGGGVRLTAKGSAPLDNGPLEMAVDIAELPLAIANGFAPGIGLGGKLAGAAKVGGTLASPQGGYDLRVTGLTATAAKGVPALAITSKGDLGNGRVTTDTAVTGGGGIRITANGSGPLSAAGPLDVAVQIRNVPLSLANGFVSGLGANGTLQGEAKVGGTVSAPTGTYNLKVTGLSTSATRGAGVPAAGIDARGRLDGQRVFTDTVVTAPSGLRVTANGSAPLGAGNLDLSVAGRAPLGFLNDTLAVSGDRIDGTATFDVKVGGPTSAPRINGTGQLANASYSNRASGLQLRGMAASIAANGTNIDVRSLRATTRNGGTISGSGRVAVDPARGFPGTINFQANNAEVVGTDIVTAITDATLKLEGPLSRRPVVTGVIRTRSVEVQIPDRIPAQYTPLPNVRHRNAPAAVTRQLKVVNAGESRGAKSEDGFLATLNIDVEADNKIFIRGMGMQAEAGGRIKITGTSANPQPVGAFELRPGRSQITVIGKRLNFTRGQVGFAGDLDPTLDFLAETPAKNITAQVVITGNASRPKIEFTSNPAVPQDEVLSRLLFDKASGELSPTQALTLAQAVAQYSGVGGGGGGPLESLRKGLGVDNLDLGAGGEGGFGIGVGRYISDNIYLGFKSGTAPEDTGVTVGIDITKNIKATGEAGAAGNTSAGVAIEWDY